ncbi:hypothetical protein NDA13_003190 [Ustilago tritici]|nr:hypothetical protein NDA13_003190 [Ustilago tritici]
MVSKHLRPRALWVTYLGFLDAPHAIKGHKVWHPALNRIVIAKDIRFSKLKQLGTDATPSDQPVLTGDSKLLRSYTWLPQSEALDVTEPDNVVQLSLPSYSRQWDSGHQPSSPDPSGFSHKWDRLMAEVEEAGEVVMDLDAIAADLRAELDAAPSEEGHIQQVSTHTDTQDMPLLETPRSDTVPDVYDGVSVLRSTRTESLDPLDLLGYTALAAICSGSQAPMISNHHLDRMAFAVTVMNGTALIGSGQQLRSANGILLEPLLLNEAKMRDDWNKWEEAMINEMASMSKMNIFDLANIPADSKLIGICWVYKLKLDAQHQATWYKARLVAQGYAQCQGLDYDQTFSPVVHLQTV